MFGPKAKRSEPECGGGCCRRKAESLVGMDRKGSGSGQRERESGGWDWQRRGGRDKEVWTMHGNCPVPKEATEEVTRRKRENHLIEMLWK